jgi:simple sugar transport system substrate-binding protein
MLRAAVVLSAMAAQLTACERNASMGDASSADARPAGRDSMRIIVVTHGQSSDPFWSVVANGVRDAAADLGVRVEYQAPASFDMVEMNNLLSAAVAAKPSGIVMSLPDPAALGGSVRSAIAAGIPIISINAGADAYRELGILAHIGQTEYAAGSQAGAWLLDANVTRVLCVNHEVGNASLDDRCRGLSDALSKRGGVVKTVSVDLSDPEDAQQRISGALAADAGIDGILTLGVTGAEPAFAAHRALAGARQVTIGTFDLSPAVLDAIERGEALFAIDQQQYLQGYLGVTLMVKYIETLAIPGGGNVILTGPGGVTRDNAARVRALSTRGIR